MSSLMITALIRPLLNIPPHTSIGVIWSIKLEISIFAYLEAPELNGKFKSAAVSSGLSGVTR